MTVVDADEFQFVIGDPSGVFEAVGGVSDKSDLVGMVDEGDGVLFVTVVTGAQWGPVEVETQLLADEPGLVGDWEEVVEIGLRCGGGLTVGTLFGTSDALVVSGRGGEYRVRISARGRSAGRERLYSELAANQSVVEHYLIQAWPAAMAAGRVLRGAFEPVDEYARDQYLQAWQMRLPSAEAAMPAVARIATDLDRNQNSRRLSGRLGHARAEYLYPDAPALLFPCFRDLASWLTCGGGLGFPNDTQVMECVQGRKTHPWDAYTSADGQIRCKITDVKRSSHVRMTWNWYLPMLPGHVQYDQLRPYLIEDSVLDIGLAGQGSSPGSTRVTVVHVGLPEEWTDDMTLIWTWLLESIDNHYSLQLKRKKRDNRK